MSYDKILKLAKIEHDYVEIIGHIYVLDRMRQDEKKDIYDVIFSYTIEDLKRIVEREENFIKELSVQEKKDIRKILTKNPKKIIIDSDNPFNEQIPRRVLYRLSMIGEPINTTFPTWLKIVPMNAENLWKALNLIENEYSLMFFSFLYLNYIYDIFG